MGEKKRRITSHDVARASGVSRATVSYILNNNPRQHIPEETRAKVLAAAYELDYHPFAPARTLRAGHSQIVLFALQFALVDPAIAHLLEFMSHRLAQLGFSMVIHIGLEQDEGSLHPSANLTPAVVVSLTDEVDTTMSQFLHQFDAPKIFFSSEWEQNQRAGVRLQVMHLIERGYRQIVVATTDRPDLQKLAQMRVEATFLACFEQGIAPPFVQVVPMSRAGANAAIAHTLKQQEPPFGICCYNDEIGIAVLGALSDQTIPVPTLVGVIGFDDIPLAQMSIPPLTTVGGHYDDIDEAICDAVLMASQGKPAPPLPQLHLVVIARGST